MHYNLSVEKIQLDSQKPVMQALSLTIKQVVPSDKAIKTFKDQPFGEISTILDYF